MFIYGSLGIIQGMFFTYLSATLSTLEKQFGIKSKESAYLVSFHTGLDFNVSRKRLSFSTLAKSHNDQSHDLLIDTINIHSGASVTFVVAAESQQQHKVQI